MSGESLDFNLLINADAEFQIEGVKQAASELESSLSKMKLPKSLEGDFKKLFSDLNANVKDFEKLGKNVTDNKGLKEYAKGLEQVGTAYDKIVKKISSVAGGKGGRLTQGFAEDNRKLMKEMAAYERVSDNIKKLQSTFKAAKLDIGTEGLKENIADVKLATTEIEKMEIKLKSAAQLEFGTVDLSKVRADFNRLDDDLTTLHVTIGRLGEELDKLESSSPFEGKAAQQDKLQRDLEDAHNWAGELQRELDQLGKVEMFEGALASMTSLKTELQSISAEDLSLEDVVERSNRAIVKAESEVRQAFEEMALSANQSGSKINSEIDETIDKVKQFVASTEIADRELNSIESSLLTFFSLNKLWHTFANGAREALEVVKELDAAMTEIAVVTDYDLSEIWDKRGEYVDRATKLGAKPVDVVKASALYYQQGLPESEIAAITEDTIKMARIGGLAGAEATDYMTSAIRGFNMEMSEGARVNDVYSQVAAKTASDTKELATAMSKTASIAHNSGSEFENITALLAAGIEATREPPAAIGTAMKTIIARFQQMRKAPSEIGMIDGEEVDANEMATALKAVGIAAMNAKGEFRDFDEVMLEISQKWDSMSTMEQRYIATTAAGARQQSRFIAMVQDYQHLMEIRDAAYNSAGAGDRQYSKTQDSMEAKTNAMKAQLDLLRTHIFPADSFTKPLMDTTTNVVGGLNSILSLLPDVIKLFGSRTLAVIAFNNAQKGIKLVFESIRGSMVGDGQSFWEVMSNMGDILGGVRKRSANQGGLKWYDPIEILGKASDTAKAVGVRFRDAGVIAGQGFSKNFLGILRGVAGEGIEAGLAGAVKGGAVLAGIIASLMLIKHIIGQMKFHSFEERMSRSERAADSLSNYVKDTSDALANLSSRRAGLEELRSSIQDMTVGTLEWQTATAEMNSQILALGQQYKVIYGYTKFDKHGVMSVSGEGWKALEAELEQTKRLQKSAQISNELRRNVLREYNTRADMATAGNKLTDFKPGYIGLTGESSGTSYVQALEYYQKEREAIMEGIAKVVRTPDYSKTFFDQYGKGLGVKDEDKAIQLIETMEKDLIQRKEAIVERTNLLMSQMTESLLEAFETTDIDNIDDSIISLAKAHATQMASSPEKYSTEFADQLRGIEKERLSVSALTMELSERTGLQYSEVSEVYGREKQALEEALAKSRALNELNLQFTDSSKTLEGLTKAADNAEEIQSYMDKVARLFSIGGEDLTFDDIEFFGGYSSASEWLERNKPEGITNELLEDLLGFDSFTELTKRADENAKLAKESMDGVLEGMESSLNFLGKGQREKIIAGLKSDTLETARMVEDVLRNTYRKYGTDTAQLMGTLISDAAANMEGGIDDFIEQIYNIDINSRLSLESFRKDLEARGYAMSDLEFENLISQIGEVQQAAHQFDLTKLRDQIDGVMGMIQAITKGEQGRVFTRDEYTQLAELLSSSGNLEELGKFQMNSSGEFVYLGRSMIDLRAALVENTTRLYDTRMKELEAAIEAEKRAEKKEFQVDTAFSGQETSVGMLDFITALQSSPRSAERNVDTLIDGLEQIYRTVDADLFANMFGIHNFSRELVQGILTGNEKDRQDFLDNLLQNYSDFLGESEQREDELTAGKEILENVTAIRAASESALSLREKAADPSTSDRELYSQAKRTAVNLNDVGLNEASNALQHIMQSEGFSDILRSDDFQVWIGQVHEARAALEAFGDVYLNKQTMMQDSIEKLAEVHEVNLKSLSFDKEEDMAFVMSAYDKVDDLMDGMLSKAGITKDTLGQNQEEFLAFVELLQADSVQSAQEAFNRLIDNAEKAKQFLMDTFKMDESLADEIIRQAFPTEEQVITATVEVVEGEETVDVDAITEKLKQLSEEEYKGIVTINIEEGVEAEEEIRRIKAAAEELGIDIQFNTHTNVSETVEEVTSGVNSVPKETTGNIDITTNAGEARSEVRAAGEEIDSVDGKTAEVNFSANVEETESRWDLLTKRLRGADQEVGTVKYRADSSKFDQTSSEVESIRNQIDGSSAHVTFTASHNFYQVRTRLNSLMSAVGRANRTQGMRVSRSGRGGYSSRTGGPTGASQASPIMMMSRQRIIGDAIGPHFNAPIIGGLSGEPTMGFAPSVSDEGGPLSSGFASPIGNLFSPSGEIGMASSGVRTVAGPSSVGGASIGGFATPITAMASSFGGSFRRNPILGSDGFPVSGSLNANKQAREQQRSQKAQEAIAERNKTANEKAAKKAERIEKGQEWEEQFWKNTVDEYYNLMRRAEKEIRIGNLYAKEYELMQLDRDLTIRDMASNLKEQKLSLEEQRKYWWRLERARKSEVADAYAKFADVQKYAKMGDGYVVEVHWDAIDPVKDEDVGKRIVEYINELERIQDRIEKVQDHQMDVKKELMELKKVGQSQYLDLEQQIMDAIVAREEKAMKEAEEQLKRTQEGYGALKDTNSTLISELKNGLSQLRQDRKLEEDLKGINEMERKLSLLESDTGGANRLEILNLQEQLATARQNYTDSLIDQAINKIDQGNQASATQRERQLKVMEESLRTEVVIKEHWEEAYDILSTALGKGDGVVPFLEEFLGRWQDVDSMSSLQKNEWLSELRSRIEDGFSWYLRAHDPVSMGYQGKTIEFAKPGGGTAKGVVGRDGSVTVNGTKYDGIYLNPNGQWVAESRKQQPKPTPKPKPQPNPPSKPVKVGARVQASPNAKIYDWRDGKDPKRQYFKDDPNYTVLQMVGEWVQLRWHKLNRGITGWMKKGDLKAYKTGGLVDYTGLAWVDGTKSNPETFLSARDTKNFMQLRDTLASLKGISNGNTNQTYGDVHNDFYISIEEMNNRENVNMMMDEIETRINKSAGKRNVTTLRLQR